jgi:hypothetical protein
LIARFFIGPVNQERLADLDAGARKRVLDYRHGIKRSVCGTRLRRVKRLKERRDIVVCYSASGAGRRRTRGTGASSKVVMVMMTPTERLSEILDVR